MKHKKDYNEYCLKLADDLVAVANKSAEDGEDDLTADEGRIFTAKGLKKNRARIIADGLRIDEEDAKAILAELDSERAKADDDTEEPVAEAS